MLLARLRVNRPLISAAFAIGLGMAGMLGSAGASSAPGSLNAPVTTKQAVRQAAAPVAAFADPGDVTVGVLTHFDAVGSQGNALSYSWDFGDGSAAATGGTVQHTFNTVNDYVVRLKVTDGQGASDTASRKIRVIPHLDSLTGHPVLGQIVPASSFSATLFLNTAGPGQISVKIGGSFLSSDRWDFDGGNTVALLEIPDIRVVNEDNPEIVSQLLSKPGSSIPLTNNVSVTISYAVSNGGSESVSYAMSLLNGGAAAPTPSPVPAAAGSPTPAPQSSAAYLQATRTPATPAPQATPSAAQTTPPVQATPPAAQATPATAAPAAATVNTWSITYPSYLSVVGLPVPSDDVDGYYLKGDPQFHSVDTLTLRQFAIKTARNGGIFPNDPQRAADNIYRYVNGLLGIGDPGELQKDLTLISRVQDGMLVPGSRKGEYICIAHAYFLSSITRTLGLPTREETIGFGRGVSQDDSGAWKLNFYQEGANEVWYNNGWHHYDTWIGTRDRDDYLSNNLTEIAWYAFSTQNTPFIDVNGGPVGLTGHDFALGKYVGSPGSPDQWRFLEQHTRPGIRIADPGPEAYLSADRAEPAPPFETVSPGIVNPPAH